MDFIGNYIDDQKINLLRLQREYRSGQITEKDLSREQIQALLDLFEKQIIEKKRKNQIRKQKLLKYRNKYNNRKNTNKQEM